VGLGRVAPSITVDHDDKGKVQRGSTEPLSEGVPQYIAAVIASAMAISVREPLARVMHKVCGVPARQGTWGSRAMLLFDIGAARRQQQRN
jgi:hypothetical protein